MATPNTGSAGVRATTPPGAALPTGMISFWPWVWNKTIYPQLLYWHKLDGIDTPDMPNMANAFVRGWTLDANVNTFSGTSSHNHPVSVVQVEEKCVGADVVAAIFSATHIPYHVRWYVMQYRPDLGP